jgi:hypothetical protein
LNFFVPDYVDLNVELVEEKFDDRLSVWIYSRSKEIESRSVNLSAITLKYVDKYKRVN